MHDFDWWLARLDVAQWKSRERGSRDVMAACPVHGGSDSLHVTEKNGKAALHCFGCSASYEDLVTAVEDAEVESTPEPEDKPAGFKVARGRRVRSARKVRGPEQTAAGADDEGSTPSASITDPLEWYAGYCGVERSLLESLGVNATADGWIAHGWPGVPVTKDRKPGTGERRWSEKGAARPRLWPLVPDELPETVWLCEGETDCIVLRASGLEHVYTSGGAGDGLTQGDLERLKARGVEHVVVAYDSDRAGQEGARKLLDAARAVGLFASVGSLGDPLTGVYKDWRERWLDGNLEPPQASSNTGLDVWALTDVKPAEDEVMLDGHVHPTDHTILFGDGGTGKGAVAAQIVADLTTGKWYDGTTHEQKRVLVLDYEAHARHEWRVRVARFAGLTDMVFIVQPTQPIWDIAQEVREVIDALDIDVVVVDSVTYACVGEEVEKSATAAKYTVAISHLKKPVLSLAHTTKTDLGAKHPFGSIFWSNGARVTINIKVDGAKYNDPRLVTCQKTNQAAPFKPYHIGWEWVDEELPDSLWAKREEVTPDRFELVRDILLTSPRWLTAGELAEQMGDEAPSNPSQAFNRYVKQGKLESDGGKPKQRYGLPGRAFDAVKRKGRKIDAGMDSGDGTG